MPLGKSYKQLKARENGHGFHFLELYLNFTNSPLNEQCHTKIYTVTFTTIMLKVCGVISDNFRVGCHSDGASFNDPESKVWTKRLSI